MFKLLASSFRLFVTSILLHLRRNSNLTLQTIDAVFDLKQYLGDESVIMVQVRQSKYVVSYNRWWLPSLARSIYHATLKKYVNNTLVDSWSADYPELSRAPYHDPAYPYLNIAIYHVDQYLERNA